MRNFIVGFVFHEFDGIKEERGRGRGKGNVEVIGDFSNKSLTELGE